MSATGWTTIRVRDARERASVIQALFAAGAEGVQELEHEVVTSLREPDLTTLASAVRAIDPGATLVAAPTPEVDWSRAWRDRIRAHRLGRLVVAPPWLAADYPVDECIVIDPGMGFGTGEHETTRGVIRLMQRVIRAGDVVADLGAGSGVLAIAAARLGAARVAAIELDPDAIGNAEENVARNGVGDRVHVIEGDAEALLPLVAPVRVILANIISSVLVALLPAMRAALRPDGQVVLSGILLEERPALLSALASGGWRVEADDAEGIWWSVAAQRQ